MEQRNPHRVTISLNHKGFGRIILDGKTVNTTHVALDCPAGQPPLVTLTIPAEVQVLTDAVVTITEAPHE